MVHVGTVKVGVCVVVVDDIVVVVDAVLVGVCVVVVDDIVVVVVNCVGIYSCTGTSVSNALGV